MNKELKRAIINWLIDNEKEFQLVNEAAKEFRQYIYTPDGKHCFGGKEVHKFIVDAAKLLTEN